MPSGRAPRIVVVSPDPALAQQLMTGLSALACAVEVQRGPGAVGAGEPAALCVVHLEGECAGVLEAPGAGGIPDGPVIAVLPRGDVAAAVAVLRASERAAGVIAADRLEVPQLTALATRIVSDDVFGLAPAMAPGTRIHARSVADHAGASRCVAEISELAEQSGVPRGCREPIAQSNARGAQNLNPGDAAYRPPVASYDPSTHRLHWGGRVDPRLAQPGSLAPQAFGEESWKWLFLQPLAR